MCPQLVWMNVCFELYERIEKAIVLRLPVALQCQAAAAERLAGGSHA